MADQTQDALARAESELAVLFARNGGSGGLPPGKPSGVIGGLNASLLALLAAFDPGSLGVCLVDEKLQMSLPIPEWSRWQATLKGSMASMSAGEGDPEPIFTVPTDERWWLDFVMVLRASGDNTITRLSLKYPEGYYSGINVVPMLDTAGGLTQLQWPDPRLEFAYVYVMPMPVAGLLLEPGTQLLLDPSAAGAGATVFDYEVLVKCTKVVRAQSP